MAVLRRQLQIVVLIIIIIIIIILRRQLISATSILLSSSFLRRQHSDPYIITGMKNVPYSFTLVAVVMLFDLHTLFIVPNITEASPILRFMSFVQRPSSVITPPK